MALYAQLAIARNPLFSPEERVAAWNEFETSCWVDAHIEHGLPIALIDQAFHPAVCHASQDRTIATLHVES